MRRKETAINRPESAIYQRSDARAIHNA